jgi:hypothetical protein
VIPIVLPSPEGNPTLALVEIQKPLQEAGQGFLRGLYIDSPPDLVDCSIRLLKGFTACPSHYRPSLTVLEQMLREIDTKVMFVVPAYFESSHDSYGSVAGLVSKKSAGTSCRHRRSPEARRAVSQARKSAIETRIIVRRPFLPPKR